MNVLDKVMPLCAIRVKQGRKGMKRDRLIADFCFLLENALGFKLSRR